MAKACETCIYRKDLAWDLDKLENEVRDPHIGFSGYRSVPLPHVRLLSWVLERSQGRVPGWPDRPAAWCGRIR